MSRSSASSGTNGHGLPMDWQGVPDDVIQRMELAYQEIQRRDSQAEQRAWRKDRLVQRLGLVIVVLVGVLVWLVLTKQQVKAFVQTVQVTDDGTPRPARRAAAPLRLHPAGWRVYGDGGAVGALDALARRRRAHDAGAVGVGVSAYLRHSRINGSRPWRRKRSPSSRGASGWPWT